MNEPYSISFTNGLSDQSTAVTFALKHDDDDKPTWYTLLNNYSVTHPVKNPKGSWTLWATVGDDPAKGIANIPSLTFLSLPPNVTFSDSLDVESTSADGRSNADTSEQDMEEERSILELCGNWFVVSEDERLRDTVQLGFTMEKQKYSQWCWAAVTASTSKFYNAQSNVTQCQLATWKFGTAGNCCTTPLPNGCNKPYTTWKALQHVGVLAAHVDEAISFADVKTQIDQGRAVAMAVKWNSSGSRHAIVITGYEEAATGNKITVQDPGGPSTSVLKFADFPGNYKGGATWAATFTTQP